MPWSPWPQALQAAPARSGPPLLAHGLWAGMQAHTSRRSRERGLGQTQSLRSRSNVAVQQVLGTHPGTGRPTGRSSPTRAHVYPRRREPTSSCRVPQTQTPRRAPRPRPVHRWGDRGPNSGLGSTRQPRGPGREECPHHSHSPGALGESLTPRRTSQQACSATNRMWPASRRHSPGLERWEGVARGKLRLYMVCRPRLVLAPPGLSVPICAMTPVGGAGDAGSGTVTALSRSPSMPPPRHTQTTLSSASQAQPSGPSFCPLC